MIQQRSPLNGHFQESAATRRCSPGPPQWMVGWQCAIEQRANRCRLHPDCRSEKLRFCRDRGRWPWCGVGRLCRPTHNRRLCRLDRWFRIPDILYVARRELARDYRALGKSDETTACRLRQGGCRS